MNLLYALTAYPPSTGGAQLLMHQLARHLQPRHHVQVVTQWTTNRTDWLLGTTLNAADQPRAYLQDGVPVHVIALPDARRRQLAPWVYSYYLLQGPALARIADALTPEIEPWAASADLVHNCRIGREGLSYASLRAARARVVPFVFTPVHHPRWGGWLHRHYHQLYRQADAVIALTPAEREMLVRLGVDERRVFVTGMGPILADSYNGERFRALHALGEEPIVLFLGQKFAYKGIATVLQAARLVWQRRPEVRFVFLGPRTRYSRRLFDGQLDRRILELDTVSLQEKTDALAACQVLCVPSTQESFGGVYTEAWSLGKPVIASDIPAVRTVVAEGEDGFLVSQKPGEVADRLRGLLDRPEVASQLGRRGQEKVKRLYSWPCLAARTEEVYAQVMRGGLG